MTKLTRKAGKVKRAKASSTKAHRSPGLSEADVERYIADNKEALEASFKRARAEYANGIYSPKSVKDIVAEGRRQFQRRTKQQS